MFGKLKDKLKGWFKQSSEKIEETIEPEEKAIEEKDVEKPTKKEKTEAKKEKPIKEKKSVEKLSKKDEKKIDKKTEKIVKKEKKKVSGKKESIKTAETHIAKEIEKEIEEVIEEKEDKKIPEKELEKADGIIEKAKKQESKAIIQDFKVGKLSFEPDTEEIKKDMKQEEPVFEEKPKEPEQKEEPEKKKGFFSKLFRKKDEKEKVEEPDKEEIKEEEPETKPKKEIVEEEKPVDEITEVKPQPEEAVPEKKSLFQRIKKSFTYTITENDFESIFDDLEMLLLENNCALEVVEDIKLKLSEKLVGKVIPKDSLEDEIKDALKESLNELLIEPDNPLDIIKKVDKPFVILFFGINGTGKTTSISKIAHFLKKSGLTVALAAGDTFRAAAIEQLEIHAKKLDVPIIKGEYGKDPASVGFDAIKYARKHKIDVVLIDTAGRMHTKANLIEEMKKIERVTSPNLKLFVAESIAGNDATEQAKTFHEAIEIDGSILSKADVDEKGGTIISVSHATNKPIFYLGTGQKYDDLELFNKQKFIENLGL